MKREYVGIDLHRRRSVIIRKNADGELLSKVHIDNDPIVLAGAVSAAGPEPEVVLEATFGWYLRPTSFRSWVAGSIWRTRWGITGVTGGSKTMSATRRSGRPFAVGPAG